jgi:glycosyltransferase involved in cell wall biosynthesis
MKIRAFTNSSGSAWWRLQSVARHFNYKTDHEFLCFNTKQWKGDSLDGDLVVFQMLISPQAILEAQKQGAKVVYEMDDLLTEKVNKEKVDDNDRFIGGMIESIKAADMVTVTTEELAKKARKFNKNVVVLPNYIDTKWWGPEVNIKRRGDIRIGWAGSYSHSEDLVFLAPIIKRIIDEFDNVKFIYCGAGGASSESEHTQLMYGKDFFTDIPVYRREFHLGSDIDSWGMKSKTLHLDIALAPLVDDEFNKCKSNIKWQEYSLNGCAGVYSDVPAYKNIKHALKAKDAEEFYKHIKFLIENPDERDAMAAKAKREIIDNWTLSDHYEKWIKAYQKCLNQ